MLHHLSCFIMLHCIHVCVEIVVDALTYASNNETFGSMYCEKVPL